MTQILSTRGLHFAAALLGSLLLCGSTQPVNGTSDGATVCETETCWSMSSSLHASLNTSASPCSDFEEFLCGGFRSSHQFTGDSLLSDKAYMDYMQQRGNAYSERVTEQLVTGCWNSTCLDSEQPASSKLRAYERVALEALRDCARFEAIGNKSLSELVRQNAHEVVEETIDLGVAGVATTDGELRYESLMPAQSAKGLLNPLTVVADFASRDGRPALLLVATEPFLGLYFVSRLLEHLPVQTVRLLRELRMHLPRGLFGLMRYAQASLLLLSHSCNRTATDVVNATVTDKHPVRTVADAKRLLRLANLTFDLDEFLRLSTQPFLAVNDSTDVVVPEPVVFLHAVCLLDQCAKRRPDLIKVLVMHQITLLAVEVLSIPSNARCFEEFFGVGGSGRSGGGDSLSSVATNAGVFRPLLHGRYARGHASATIDAEARAVFAQLKATYAEALTAGAWIPSQLKPVLSRRVQTVELKLHSDSVRETNLLRHYGVVMDGMPPRGCTLAVSPACLLVRARALQMSLAVRSIHLSLDNESPHYNQFRHSVYLTPAFSEAPHYRPGQPLAVRLGLLGFVFAHELTHALLAETSPGDKPRGQVTNDLDDQLPANWPEDFVSEFRSREACLRERLAAEQRLNKTSVAEDVADQIGLSVAHRALVRSGDFERLPGYMARYSSTQLLYMASMRTFCSKAVPGFWQRFLSVSARQSHTPGRMRIQSMLNGDGNFARAFGCPAKAGPSTVGETSGAEKRKCEFW